VTKFLEALGGKLAERWLSLLVLPGLLLLATAWAGHLLGHRHWHDLDRLTVELNRLADQPAWRATGTLALALAGLVLAALGIGLTAQAAGAGVERLWLSSWPRRLTERRRRRWHEAQEAFETALLAAARADREGRAEAPALAADARRLDRERDRIGVVAPTHPFWLGDRLDAPGERAHRLYALDLATTWPRLWLIVPPEVRAELEAARSRSASTARLMAWAVGYLAVGVVWWPAAVAAVVTALVAWRQSRDAAAVLADLVDAAVDLHGRRLAEALGVSVGATLTPEAGAAVTALLRRGPLS
jgi:hypothetical protein